jgi:hypothetical protein
MVYVDSSRPQLVEGFTRRTFTAMVDTMETWRPPAAPIRPRHDQS